MTGSAFATFLGKVVRDDFFRFFGFKVVGAEAGVRGIEDVL
jgi:hypothetical protein